MFSQTIYIVFTPIIFCEYKHPVLTLVTVVRKKGETMLGAHEQRSEVARLLARISDEYEAAQRGLSGLAYGVSQHDFITARMENMGQLHSQLQTIVGDVAIAMIADQLNNCR